MTRDLTGDSWRYLLVNRPSAHLTPIGSHLHHFVKLITCTEDDHAHQNHWQVTFASYHLYHHDMHMFWDCRQSPLKALLNMFGMCHKTHGMSTRYRYQDTGDIPDTPDSTPWISCHMTTLCQWETMIHPINRVKELTLTALWLTSYSSSSSKNQFASLKSSTPQSTSKEELSQLTDKLQHLTMALQPTLESSEEPVHKTMQAYTDTCM